jgi:N-acetylmuramoyl-L-alanine amidase
LIIIKPIECQGISGFMPQPYANRRLLITAMSIMALMLCAAAMVHADESLATSAFKTVALDPGHGGDDSGARGSTGALEKAVCLDLARALADGLKNRFQVVLTRSDDYSVDLRQRTAVANNRQADLMISIHCGAGFLHTASGMAVYYWKPEGLADDPSSAPGSLSPNRWDQTQLPYLAGSRTLAAEMQHALQQTAGSDMVRVYQAPLLVLQGAAMPAIIIEIGYITHPATEKDLMSPQWRQQLARSIQVGIENFLERPKSQP